MELRYEFDGMVYLVQLEPQSDGTYKATIDDHAYDVEVLRLPTGQINLVINGETLRTFYEQDNNKNHFVAVREGSTQHYTFTTPTMKSNRRRGSAAQSGKVEAQMPGQVIELLAQIGDEVQQGQTLLILEAMKMEIRVAAPAAGTVTELFVQQGDTVDRGQELLIVKNNDENVD